MDKKTGGIIATVATALLCGCPGLGGLCWGLIALLASFVPGSQIDIMGSSDPNRAMFTGLGALFGGIIFIAIPVVVGVVTLRKPKSEVAGPVEPLPPAA